MNEHWFFIQNEDGTWSWRVAHGQRQFFLTSEKQDFPNLNAAMGNARSAGYTPDKITWIPYDIKK